ncbi:MAG: hypothetical protein NVV63_00375 [Opitutus sp.]|nr:hypothetical protein [Opitutus sp.]
MSNAPSSSPRNETPEQVLEHITQLMDEAEALLVGPTTEHVGEQLTEMQTKLERMQQKIASLYGDARQKVTAGARVTDQAIRAHPYEALAIALGAGVLVGALLGRSLRK